MAADADWNGITRTISLHRSTPFEQKVGDTLFELCNAQQTATLNAITDEGRAGNLSLALYAEKCVKTEWASMHCHHEVASRCIQSQGWNETFDRYRTECETWLTAEAFWNVYKSGRGYSQHFEHLAYQWVRQFQAFYCRKHPDGENC